MIAMRTWFEYAEGTDAQSFSTATWKRMKKGLEMF